ncbi:MAG: aminomethyl transferase family protein [Opitutales bacterium]|nr:aminomethyl transferase family protein [Opitutales bacterium]MBT5167178.1 aminomethyl transferase family protein [Opitutales bacterium]MBT5812794.1 aminomethyl transferase family protein [Opitutales bacterium]
MNTQNNASLEAKLQAHPSPVEMLRHAQVGGYDFPFPGQYTNWRDEQEAWQKSVVLFDQSFHMTDVYFEGPDVKRLLSDIGVNTLKNFGTNKAKQFVACNYDGYVIGDAILFGHAEGRVSVVGRPSVPNWVHFHAESGNYDVKVTRDERTVSNDDSRLIYRYQIQGPNALDLIKSVHEGEFPDIKFFNLGDLKIAGKKVRALNHNMSRMGGLELHGPVEDRDIILEALLKAGPEFDLVMGGSRAYSTVSPESGWIPSPMPAIYSGEAMKPYREWLSANGFEANASLGGSFYSDNIEDYYQTPWDLGYGKHINFDHDFIGRAALEKMADQPHRRKVWLKWNDEDVQKVFASQLGSGDRFKYMEVPNAYYSILPFDKIVADGRVVGLSTYTVYTSNVRSWFSLAMVDEDVPDNTEVNVVWGEEDGGSAKPVVERHIQTNIRATVSFNRLNED